MRSNTFIYELLANSIAEAKIPDVPADFESEWPKVAYAINFVRSSKKPKELFISGRSSGAGGYEASRDVKIKVVVLYKENPLNRAEYAMASTPIIQRPVKYDSVKAFNYMHPAAVYYDFMTRIIDASGDNKKVRSLKLGLYNKFKKYGANEAVLKLLRDDIDEPEGDLDRLKKEASDILNMLKMAGTLAKGEVRILVEPGVPALQYKAAFFHELVHAFDPKVHLPHRIANDQDSPDFMGFYMVDPVELDAAIGEFGVVAKEFPEEFNTAVFGLIKKGFSENKFVALIEKKALALLGSANSETERHLLISQVQLYTEKLMVLLKRIKSSKDSNKFFQKLMNVMVKPSTSSSSSSLQDRLAAYKSKHGKKSSSKEVGGFWDDNPESTGAGRVNQNPFEFLRPEFKPVIWEILRDTYGTLNEIFSRYDELMGKKNVTITNSIFKGLSEYKRVIGRYKTGQSDGRKRAIMHCAFVLAYDRMGKLRSQFMKKTNSPYLIDDNLLSRMLIAVLDDWESWSLNKS